jgi:Glycosyl transferase family 2
MEAAMKTIDQSIVPALTRRQLGAESRSRHLRAMAQLERCLRDTRSNRTARRYVQPRVAVAIPVCNEVERIIHCVDSLDAQQGRYGQPFAEGALRVVLLMNGCTDGTYQVVIEHLEKWCIGVSVFDVSLPQAHRDAGHARYLANHAAVDLLPDKGGLLFMTDADSCAPPHWVSVYASMLRAGHDVVMGCVDLRPDDCPEPLTALKHRGELEDHYTRLLDCLECLLDPIAHDPWPRHFGASGANIAMRVEALQKIADFPQSTCGEDKLLARMLEAGGCRIRHDCETKVHTSGRLFGRAVGGMADTMRMRIRMPSAPCDERLERADQAYFRARLRRALRDAPGVDGTMKAAVMTVLAAFEMNIEDVPWDAGCSGFEPFWQALEQRHPQLQRQGIAPGQLVAEIERAEQLLRLVDQRCTYGGVMLPEDRVQVA